MRTFESPYPRCALYARGSGSEDSEDQRGPLRAKALKEGWERIAEFVDSGPELSQRQQLIAAARAREFDVVLFHSLGKLCEDGFTATVGLLDELAGAGVEWLAVAEENLESTRLLRQLLQLVGRKGK